MRNIFIGLFAFFIVVSAVCVYIVPKWIDAGAYILTSALGLFLLWYFVGLVRGQLKKPKE